MNINLLGPLSLTTDHVDKPVGSSQVRTVLALLALGAGRGVSTERLIDELWPEAPVRNARNALQAALTRLRRVLTVVDASGAVTIRTIPNGYVLDGPPGCVDAHRFTDLLERGLTAGSDAPEDALADLQTALQLWRGPALLDVTGGPQVRAEQIHLDEKRLEALEALCEVRLQLGESRPVVSELKRLVEIHPERERFSELLMLALYRGGQQTEALAVFRRVRARLGGELGLNPGRGLCQLNEAILSQDVALDGKGPLVLSRA